MPDLVGFQEVLHDQLQFLEKQLPEYRWIGCGRDDGFASGEYCPIFYNGTLFRARFTPPSPQFPLNCTYSSPSQAETAGTFWLSETPWTPGSRSWGASLPRICTWVVLSHISSNRRFAVFNTHLDHMSINARANGISITPKFDLLV